MEREAIEQWKATLKKENPLGMAEIIFDVAFCESYGQLYLELNIAKLIARLLPNAKEEALEIYLNTLQDERIQQEIHKAYANENFADEHNIEFENLVEQIVHGYLNCTELILSQSKDLNKALEYITKGIEIIGQYPVHLTYISKGELYYTKWKILENLNKHEEIFREIESFLY